MLDESSARPLNALILEEDEEHARALAATFELQGISTTVLHSMEHACECISRLQPQIVTYDLGLTRAGEQDLIGSLRKMRAKDIEHMVLFSRTRECKTLIDGLDDDLGQVFVRPVKLSQVLALVIKFKARFRDSPMSAATAV